MYRPQIGRQTHAFDLCQATVKEEGRMWTGLGRQREKLRLQGQHEEEGKKETMLMQTAIRMPISLLLCYETTFFLSFTCLLGDLSC